MLDKKRLAEIRDRADAASPGPWFAHKAEFGLKECRGITTSPELHAGDDIVVTDSGVYPPEMPDALFIAHARTDVPDLLAEVERLRRIARCANSLSVAMEAFPRPPRAWQEERDDLREVLRSTGYKPD